MKLEARQDRLVVRQELLFLLRFLKHLLLPSLTVLLVNDFDKTAAVDVSTEVGLTRFAGHDFFATSE